MSEPYVGEIRMVGFSFAPQGWAFCDGSLLSIASNEVLFNLIGTTYGGDGVSTFALPDLRGRIPFHQGTGQSLPPLVIGQASGSEAVTLITSQLPAHTHTLAANSSAGTGSSPKDSYWAASTLAEYATEAVSHTMAPAAVSLIGGGLPHDNMPPFVTINFVISLFGIYPSQN